MLEGGQEGPKIDYERIEDMAEQKHTVSKPNQYLSILFCGQALHSSSV